MGVRLPFAFIAELRGSAAVGDGVANRHGLLEMADFWIPET
jgi:hypothetical protein